MNQRQDKHNVLPQKSQEENHGESVPQETPAERAEGVPFGEAASDAEAESVTRLGHFSEVIESQFLASGFDSLDLGLNILWGNGWETLSETFERVKEAAYGTKGILFVALPNCIILPSGKPPNYRWHFEFPECHLFLGKSATPQENLPNGYVSIKARALWELTIPVVVAKIKDIVRQLGGCVTGLKPSRCDMSADFLLNRDLTLEFLTDHRVPANVKHRHHMTGRSLETFYHGGGKSPTQLRIYNKGLEIESSGEKYWFLQIWNTETVNQVWRVEFQLRRPTLKAFGIHTLEDLSAKAGGLWEYLTGKWFSLRFGDNQNVTRCGVVPWWQEVQDCALRFGVVQKVARSFVGEPANSTWYVSHCAGCLAGFAACEGFTSLEMAGSLLFARMKNYWRSRDFAEAVAMKSIRLGVPGECPDGRIEDSSKDA